MRKKTITCIFRLKCLRKLILLMNLTNFFILLTTLQLSASTYSQNARVSLHITNGTLTDIFKEIENQSEFKIFYKVDQIDLKAKLSYTAENKLISDVLNTLLAAKGATYDVVDKVIVITPATTAVAQNLTITGKVADANGLPLIGVNVVVRGTTRGVITDADGKFSIVVPDANAVLLFSFVGYLTEERPIGGQSTIDITLVEDIKNLEEIVVVGYGAVKKSDVTGAVSRLGSKELEDRPVQNAVQAMQGKTAGVDIISNVRPGEVASISIRGTRSFSTSISASNNTPLYVVDGIILMGTINDINPDDIATIDVLKDASATAIYGARGSNGVVLVTTKKGTKGQVSVKYDATLSFDNVTPLTDWASGGEALDRYRLAAINGGTYTTTAGAAVNYPNPDADIKRFGNGDQDVISSIRAGYEWNDPGTFADVKLRDATQAELDMGYPAQVPAYSTSQVPTTNWIKRLTRTGVTQNHVLSISAGNETSKLYLSVGYLKNDGTQKNQSYERYTIKANGDINPFKWFTAGTSVSASFSNQHYGTIYRSGSATGPQDAYGMALSQYVLASPYDGNGNLNLNPGNNTGAPVWNPLIDLNNTDDQRRAINILANLYGEIKFTSWLKYRMNFGSGFRYNRNGTFQGSQSTLRRPTSATAVPGYAAATYRTEDNSQYMLENLLYLDKSFGVHTIGVTLLQSVQDNRNEFVFINASKIMYDTPEWYNQAANLNGNPDSYGTGFNENKLMSFMGRLNYTLLGRYLLTATIRRDGSSVLAPGHKWDLFPSFAAAWKLQEESFLKSVKWINEIKLRAGYGVVGNSNINAYSTSAPLSQYNYVFNNGSADVPAIGFNPYFIQNPELRWERSEQVNVGLDFGLLKNRVTGSMEIYRTITSNNLMDQNIPAVIGYPVITSNIGKVRNRGFELTVSTVNVQTKDFRWSTDLNYTRNKEEIMTLVNGAQDMPGNGWYIGQPIQDMRPFRGYLIDGLW